MKSCSILLSLFLIICFNNNVYSQETSFGLKGGINIATLGGDATDVKSKVGFHLGGYASFNTSDHLTIQPELYYSTQGTKDDSGDDLELKYNYINIPLIFKIFPSEGFNIQAGPQLGIMTTGKVSIGGIEIDAKDELQTIDFAIVLGLGYDLENINFAARYNLGVSNTFKDAGGESYPNRVIQFSIGYTF